MPPDVLELTGRLSTELSRSTTLHRLIIQLYEASSANGQAGTGAVLPFLAAALAALPASVRHVTIIVHPGDTISWVDLKTACRNLVGLRSIAVLGAPKSPVVAAHTAAAESAMRASGVLYVRRDLDCVERKCADGM